MIGGQRISGLRHRVVIEAPVETFDTIGGLQRSFATFAETWAAIEPSGVSETYAARGEGSLVTHRVRLRWRADIHAGMRLRLGERILEIRAVHDADDRRREMICRCEEVVT